MAKLDLTDEELERYPENKGGIVKNKSRASSANEKTLSKKIGEK